MDVIRFAITKPVTISVGVLLIVLFGVISFMRIPVQLTPEVTRAFVSVTTLWEGATPQQIEAEVVQEQEDKLKSIANLRTMISSSTMSRGQILLEFALGTPKELALREVSDKLREVPEYPENVDEPVIETSNPMDRDYIAWIVISCSDDAYDIRRLQDFAEDRIKPELERVAGVSEVNVIGGFEREVQVRVDVDALAQRGIGPSRLIARLRSQNLDASAGQVAEGKLDVQLRSVGRFNRLDQIENTLLSEPGDPVVRVRDVATAVLTYKEATRSVRNKGRGVLAINAQREVGANVIEVMAGLKAALARVESDLLPAEARRLGLDGEFHAEQVYDQTHYIFQAIDLVRQNLWIGGAIAVATLLLFLRSVRSTLIITIAIPVSVVGTFVVMAMLNRTVNVISLAGLAFAVGMVVDNAIVVLENIDRHRRFGGTPANAAYGATREVWGAVLASTLTTLCVFIPVLFMDVEAGQLFRDIAIAICAAVTLSLVVSVTVIPAAAARWLPVRKAAAARQRPIGPLATLGAAIGHLVRDAIAWLTRSWVVRPLLIVGLTAASIVCSYLLMPPASYLPGGNRNLVFGMLFTPPGYNIQQQERIGDRLEARLRPYWEANYDERAAATLDPVPFVDPFTGEPTTVVPPPLENFFFVAAPGTMFMGGTSADPNRVKPVQALMNDTVMKEVGVIGFAQQSPLFRTATRGGDAMDLEIVGADLEQVNRVAGLLYMSLGERFGPALVRPTPFNFNLPGQEVVVDIRPVEAADVGLTQADINAAVQMFGDGAIIGDYFDRGENIDLKVIAAGSESGDATAFASWPVATPIGRVVPLSSVAQVRRAIAPQEISRVEEQRAVTLSIQLEGQPLEQAMTAVETTIARYREAGEIPNTIATNLAGSAAKLTEVKQEMLGRWTGFNWPSVRALISSRLFLALVVVFLLLAALFESWLYPLVIMFSVPLATVGGFLGLRLVHSYIDADQNLDVLTMLGFIILIGIVVNNAILIVHQTLNLIRGNAEVVRDGQVRTNLAPKDAIAEAVRTRVRPIFMTTLTSVGGMMPLVLFPGSGSELYRGLGSVVVGGLLISTIFTLLLVPLLLSVLFDVRAMIAGSAVGRGVAIDPGR